jgi:hypothetical protein
MFFWRAPPSAPPTPYRLLTGKSDPERARLQMHAKLLIERIHCDPALRIERCGVLEMHLEIGGIRTNPHGTRKDRKHEAFRRR